MPTPQIFTHSCNATARIFWLKQHITANKVGIITESTSDLLLLQKFATTIGIPAITLLETTDELLSLRKEQTGIFVAHPQIFRTIGNLRASQNTHTLAINRGETLPPESFVEHLAENNYQYTEYIDGPFQYRKEGGILHITAKQPHISFSLEWFGDELDSIIAIDTIAKTRTFISSLILPRQTAMISNSEIPYNSELLIFFQQFLEHSEIILIGGDFDAEIALLQQYATIHLSHIHHQNGISLDISVPNISSIQELLQLIRTQSSCLFLTQYDRVIQEWLTMQGITHATVQYSPLRMLESFICGSSQNIQPPCVITDDILGKIFVKHRSTRQLSKNIDLLLSLQENDLVVHRDHGIGKFVKIVQKTLGNISKEYIEIAYADDDRLFVPMTEIVRISKYLGKSDKELTSLQGKTWEKTIEKTEAEIAEIAENLMETQAKRNLLPGRPFASFPEEEKKFQDAFPYEYTKDQQHAIREIFADMELAIAMDRLLSGDVGFGKTEIAMNAAYKAVLDGVQVAVTSPLIVLAMEHFETFQERMSSFGIRVALLSRMNTAKETSRILTNILQGNVDIVIGTHRLFSPDVLWKKLGLLIIDEEHKFGVLHKESIKKIRATVDILSLSATPIPRSLNLALSGVRKISLLTTPPKKKKPIETIITSWNESIISQAILNELARDGQVIIIHNRIHGMEALLQSIAALVPKYANSIITTHGRMHGNDIEDRIHAFKQKKYRILITTTIIENGVNFLSANSIIIIDPEEFGLANLHQLRGRVGRKSEQGYCYLVYRKPELSTDEKERLITLANNNALGAGFEIAMRDMEIRGAGDILGVAQSGKTKEIGLPLYLRMLEEKVAALQNSKPSQVFPKIELNISYTIPETYFLSEGDKLNFYREIELISTLDELQNIEHDLYAHFPDKKEEIRPLFLLFSARIILSKYQVTKVSKNGQYYHLEIHPDAPLELLKQLLDTYSAQHQMVLVSRTKIRIEAGNFVHTEKFLASFLPSE